MLISLQSYFDELEDDSAPAPAPLPPPLGRSSVAALPAVPSAAAAKAAPVVFSAGKALGSSSPTAGRPPTRPMGPSRSQPAAAPAPAPAPKAGSLSSTISAMKTAQGVEDDDEPDLDLKVMTYGKFDKATGPVRVCTSAPIPFSTDSPMCKHK